AYQAAILPALGWGNLLQGETTLVVRKDLGSVLSRDDWNTVAVRARGNDLWILVNDQVVAQANNSKYDRGRIWFALRRMGDINDPPETAAVFRNLRISGLASGDPSRVPAVQQVSAPAET